MKKVYCKNCKYGTFFFSNRNWKWCENKKAAIAYIKKEFQELGLSHTEACNRYPQFFRNPAAYKRELNSNNQCIYYKKKWWKFWI